MIKISPSVLSADFLALENDIRKLEAAGVDMLHLDVMDGNFVPNLSFGAPIVDSIRKHTDLPLDVHLMIDRPHRYAKDFFASADYLGFHYEAGSNVTDLLKEIKAANKKTCLTIKPATAPEQIFEYLPLCDMVLVMSVEPGFGGQKFMPMAVDKIKTFSEYAKLKGLNYEIEVDGGINAETAKSVIDAGANVLVMGSYIFSADDMEERVKKIKAL